MERRFTGRQLTAMVIAVCTAIVLAPVGAMAATGNLVNLTDPVHRSQKARVSSTGRLVTAPCDGNSCATVDGSSLRVGGKVAVTDGGRSVTVDGAVSSRPLAPAKPWFADEWIDPGAARLMVGPTSSPINISSVSVSPLVDSGVGDMMLRAFRAPGNATTCTYVLENYDRTLWRITAVHAPFAQSFPVPIQWRPAAGTKTCLYAVSLSTVATQINADGFLGT